MTGWMDVASLDDATRSVWAKTRTDAGENFALVGWLPLYQHLDDAAGVAGLLWDEWVPHSVIQLITRTVGSEKAARALVVWLAGIHDVGKASPAFAVQVPMLADRMREFGLECDPTIRDGDERRQVRHELVSHLAVMQWLSEKHGFDAATAASLASVAAAHHGRPAGAPAVPAARDRPHLVGTGAWVVAREQLLTAADAAFSSSEDREQWQRARYPLPVLVLLSALVIVADWIASSDLFAPAPLGGPATSPTPDRVREAWRELDFPRRWQPKAERVDAAASFASRFSLPRGATPHPSQVAFVEMAQTVSQPELMILESEMGSGKTEAALLAAETLAARFGMSGVFIGLPTQATADGMFSRILDWTERLGLEAPASVFLARSRAVLNRDFENKKREARFRSMGDTYGHRREATSASLVVAHRWFSDPRRGPLSNFVVGTVDQALFAGLRGRYVMLRHLALASKVVIIDEVHAYDAYMQEYFVRVLEWLGAYGTPVVLLSATLPSGQRRRFIEAYDRGRQSLVENATDSGADDQGLTWAQRRARRDEAKNASAERYAALDGVIGCPAISRSVAGGSAVVTTPEANGKDRLVNLVRMDDDLREVVGLLRSALREGGCAAVIRNTVRRAQETVATVRDAFADESVEIILAHSRFLGIDRSHKDRRLLELFGRSGARPRKSIVVATQVIEQSLDIDFDLIVTDVAPVDLLLQRSGRLHRHPERERPSPLRDARLVLVADEWKAVPPTFDEGTKHVYAEAVLLRTAAALLGRDTVRLPDDIPALVETVYGGEAHFVPESWRPALEAATLALGNEQARKRHAADSYRLGEIDRQRHTLLGWINGPDVDPEMTPPGRKTVRDTEETLEVVVLQRDGDGNFYIPSWVTDDGGRQVPTNEPPDWRMTRTILGCMLRLPAGMCRGNALDRHIATLKREFDLPAWHSSPSLKGELVLALDMDGRGSLNEFDLSYSPEDGFAYERRGA